MVRCCKGCTLVSAPNPSNPMKRRTFPMASWVDVAMDFLGPLPSSDYLFVMVDYYSRYKEIKIMRTIDAKNTIGVMKEIFSRLGFPKTITADNGPIYKQRDKIPSYPDVENHPNDIEARNEDKENKEKGKQYSDRKRRAAENKVADGEKVYVKNLLKENKITPTFDPTPYTMIKANGKDVLVRNEETGKEYRRNIIHLKKKEGEWMICSDNGKNIYKYIIHYI